MKTSQATNQTIASYVALIALTVAGQTLSAPGQSADFLVFSPGQNERSGLFLAGDGDKSRQAAEFYVAVDGNDSNPGTKTKPFGTLERARDAVRGLNREARQHGLGAVIWVRGGDYIRTNAFELTAPDSGTAEAPVLWRAFKGERPRLLGGRRLSGFRPVTEAAVLARLPQVSRSNVLQVDLHALGITDFGNMKSRGFGRPTSPAHCELFFDGRPMTLARWPNEGEWERIAGFPEASGHNDEHGGRLGKLENGFNYSGDRPRAWRDLGDVWVHGYWAWDWANSYEQVVSFNLGQRLITTAAPFGIYGFRKGQRFYFLNVLEELDQPGEWFLDRNTARLYFWPPRRIPPAGQTHAESPVVEAKPASDAPEIILSLLAEPLIKLVDASHVRLCGLTLEATRANAIEIRGGVSNQIAGCSIRNIGDSGVVIDGGSGHGVLSCDILDTGDGGVSLSGGDRQTLTPGAHFVENCHFARQGRWSKCYVPAIMMNGVGMRASHNLIQEHPHCAILFNGNDHLIEFNEIHHIALETGDVGAIYTGRDYTYRGNRIRYNFIHDTGGVGMGSMGVYMDDCVSGTEISGNVFYRVQRAAFLGGGRDHQVVNNLFVECNPAVQLDGRGQDTSPVWHDMVDKTMRRSLANVPLALYRERYPALKALDNYYGVPGGPAIEGDAFKGVPPGNNLVARNVCVGKWLEVGWHATPQMLRLENNVTNANPEFVREPGNPAKSTDFALKADSAARKSGLEPIPLERIGLYPDEFRDGLARWQAGQDP